MILSIGEILADMIGENENGITAFKMYCGGAPFNVAVNAKQAGAQVGFIGKVGRDPVGKFLLSYASRVGFDCLDIQTDTVRNTTLAFVTLTDGERDFAFFRHDTADFNMDADKIDFSAYANLSTVHLGSLMLSEKKGREFADKIVEKTKSAGKVLSFDVNFRLDLYEGIQSAVRAYKPYVDAADILKFSEDEITAYTGIDDFDEAVAALYKKDRLLLITMGGKGSMYIYNDLRGTVPTEKVKPVDTTGAGDAFFGTALACLDGVKAGGYTSEIIENALVKANKAGARATLFKGAVKL